MDYADALKKVQSQKTKENFLVIEFGYSTKAVLPYKDGMALMASLANAEQLHEEYNQQHFIGPFDRGAIKSHVMSAAEYENYKIALLLGLKPEEVKHMRAAAESVKKDETNP